MLDERCAAHGSLSAVSLQLNMQLSDGWMTSISMAEFHITIVLSIISSGSIIRVPVPAHVRTMRAVTFERNYTVTRHRSRFGRCHLTEGPQCKILTSAVVAHECFAALAAGSGMPSGCQLDSRTGTVLPRAGNEAALSEAAGAARNRCKTLVNTMRRAHRRRAGEGRAASSPSSARFESQPVSGRACPS